MGQLEDMTLLVRIAEAGSISKAADQLGTAKSAVSRRLKQLEQRVGARLLERTTRRSKLTQSGEDYYHRSKQILDQVQDMHEHVGRATQQAEGTLKLSAPLSFGLLHLQGLLDEFTQEHPRIKLRIDFSDRYVDLIEDGFECAIRIGELENSSLQAKRLTPIRHLLCVSPIYLDQRGTPTAWQDFSDHDYLQYRGTKSNRIHIADPKGYSQTIEMNTKIQSNNGDFLKEMALCGHGISYLPSFLIHQEIASGQLIQLLPEYQLPAVYAYAVYPQNRYLSQRCRAFIDFVAERLGEQPYWDYTSSENKM